MSTLTDVVDALKAELPATIQVVPYATTLDNVTKPMVMVSLTEVRPIPEVPKHRTYAFDLVVISPYQAPERESDLVDLTNTVLGTVEDADLGILWESATRSVYADTWPAYVVRTNVQAKTQ